ncbi:MAG: ribonuclease III [Clostridia bacterium]|nr:ribonuclease III [Clostridia bacterium]
MLETPKMEAKEAALLNPLQLAYMGDSVWEMLVRSRLIFQKKNVHHMHTECVQRVNAAAQAQAMELIHPMLTEEESSIFQRGRNAHARHPSPRHQAPADYAEATGFEALMGYLYLTGALERIRQLADVIFEK